MLMVSWWHVAALVLVIATVIVICTIKREGEFDFLAPIARVVVFSWGVCSILALYLLKGCIADAN